MNTEVNQQNKRIYCAIYTRKSTSEGLNQDFTSLDSQREAAENYINSQKHEGWTVLQERYDDGFTGVNTNRPALQKMIIHIKDGQISCIIVYKVDRLSRSLSDFAKLLEFFEKNNVAFVSVTQQFNTNTSMGRLMLNILLSFAQFERGINTRERTKDKMSAARRRGQWVGGWIPLGYELEKGTKRLIINPKEAEIIRDIFNLYLIEGNTQESVVNIVNERGWKTKTRITKEGKIYDGKKIYPGYIQWILKNVIYIGKINYNGQIYDGQQTAIVDEETFNRVQQKLDENKVLRKAFKYSEHSGLLKNLLKCKVCGCPMKFTYTFRKGQFKYRYYICTDARKHSFSPCPNKSINAKSIEDETLAILRKILREDTIIDKMGHATEINILISAEWNKLRFDGKYKILRTLIKEIDCDGSRQKLGITFRDSNIRMEFDINIVKSNFLTRWHKEKEIIKLPKILRSLIFAHQLQQLMDKGQIKDTRQASEWLHISQSRLNHILSLLLLSPSIQSEIINGDPQKIDLIPEYKVIAMVSEPIWDKQAKLWQEIKQSLPAVKSNNITQQHSQF